ncbi:MAG: RluA family pseudouridine synthase [Clostridiales bacterium]|nr:RluA family pseudouridine synthase [Clostridiales bacterium]MCF8022771.1 RluA family pseudouridine synthase [Clostridiales bacterium]
MQNNTEFIVNKYDKGQRLDIYLSYQLSRFSRSRVKKLIESGKVSVNGKKARTSCKLNIGDKIILEEPQSDEFRLRAENIPLDIYYQDHSVIVINKPRGMVVHPAAGNWEGTLVNALLYHFHELYDFDDNLRPGIVHRLDKDTSGLLVITKDEMAREHLVNQLKERKVVKKYLALVNGKLKNKSGIIDAPIGRHPVDRKKMAVVESNSKPAVTKYRVLDYNGDFSLVDLKLYTGRTHQIRVHMAYIKYPLAGDTFYGPRKPQIQLDGQFLHAYRLGFIHPEEDRYLEFNAPLPSCMQNILSAANFDIPDVSAL